MENTGHSIWFQVATPANGSEKETEINRKIDDKLKDSFISRKAMIVALGEDTKLLEKYGLHSCDSFDIDILSKPVSKAALNVSSNADAFLFVANPQHYLKDEESSIRKLKIFGRLVRCLGRNPFMIPPTVYVILDSTSRGSLSEDDKNEITRQFLDMAAVAGWEKYLAFKEVENMNCFSAFMNDIVIKQIKQNKREQIGFSEHSVNETHVEKPLSKNSPSPLAIASSRMYSFSSVAVVTICIIVLFLLLKEKQQWENEL